MSLSLVDRIYECSFFPDLWPGVLTEIATLGAASGGVLFAANPTADILRWTSSETVRPEMTDYVADGWLMKGGRLGRTLAAQHAGFLTELDIFTDHELEEDPLYRDFLRPKGWGWCAGTAVMLPTNDVLIMTIERRLTDGPVESEVVRMLDGLRPHLARSALMAARLQLERAQTAADTLGLLGLPAVVLDSRGRALAANRQIEDLHSHVRWRAKDQIALKDPAAERLLQSAVAQTATRDSGAAQSLAAQSFAVRGAEDAASMVAHLIPVRGAANDIFARAAAILVMTPVTLPHAPPVELVQSLFDLTAAEAGVARSLAAGDSLFDIAANRQVSRGTVRTQMRRILEKTGCHRQAEVVALLSGVSAAPAIR
jgi:DNA-binding CsgD family transcriptional regulator